MISRIVNSAASRLPNSEIVNPTQVASQTVIAFPMATFVSCSMLSPVFAIRINGV